MKKKVLLIALFCAIAFVLTACTQAENVRHNLKREADDFNVRRRITVLNTRTDTPMMQITGLLSINVDSDGDLNITIEKEENQYKKMVESLQICQQCNLLHEIVMDTDKQKDKE